MTDFDTIWRTQDEIRTVVNAVVGECNWAIPADYDGVGRRGTKFVFYL